MFVLRSTPNHSPFKCTCPFKKRHQIRHIYLTCVTLHSKGFRFVLINLAYRHFTRFVGSPNETKGDKGSLVATYFPSKPNLSYPLQPSQLLFTSQYQLSNFDLSHFPHLLSTHVLILITLSSTANKTNKEHVNWQGY